MTAQPHAHVRFRRAIERRALWLAEDAARELARIMGTSVSMIEAHYGALLDTAHESLLERLDAVSGMSRA